MSVCITVKIAETRGSTPREAGTVMRIWEDRQDGTIGGGRLEYDTTHIARQMLRNGTSRLTRRFSLGPELGQCCGGSVVLEFSDHQETSVPVGTPLWVWGAGHVGRAIISVIVPMQDREITWIDTSQDRFPEEIPSNVHPLAASDLTRVTHRALKDAQHLIFTYSHDLDLKLCDALLSHGFGFAGLIGSATKWARFRKRLAELGHSDNEINRITCPIGDPTLGKHPQAIAVGVVAELLRTQDHREEHHEPTAHSA